MTACERCDGQGEVFDRKDFWGNDLTVVCPDCGGAGQRNLVLDALTAHIGFLGYAPEQARRLALFVAQGLVQVNA